MSIKGKCLVDNKFERKGGDMGGSRKKRKIYNSPLIVSLVYSTLD